MSTGITPKPIVSLSTVLNTNSTVSLNINWSPVIGATGYKFDVSLYQNFPNFIAPYYNFPVNGLGYTVNGLPATTVFWVRVKAFGPNFAESPYSDTQSIAWGLL
jgi:hypothetical protein